MRIHYTVTLFLIGMQPQVLAYGTERKREREREREREGELRAGSVTLQTSQLLQPIFYSSTSEQLGWRVLQCKVSGRPWDVLVKDFQASSRVIILMCYKDNA